MRNEYNLKVVTSLVTLITSTFISIILQNPVFAGIGLIASFVVFKSAEKTSNIYGKTERIKITNMFTSNLIEFTGLTLTAFFNPELVVSLYTTALIGFWIAFQSETKDKLNIKVPSVIRRKERVYILSLIFVASYLNPYLMLYGLLGLSTIVLTNLTRTIYILFTN